MRVLVFGDSIVLGMFDGEHGGWVQILARQYLRHVAANPLGEWNTLYNLGIAGDTATNLNERIANEAKARKWRTDPFAIVVAIGINDSIIENAEPWSSPESYGKQLVSIYRKAVAASDKVMFIGMNAVGNTRCSPVPFDVTVHYSTERIRQFEQVLRAFVKEKSLPFVPLFEEFSEQQRSGKNLLDDGIHPNSAGHTLIADLVKPKLDKLIATKHFPTD